MKGQTSGPQEKHSLLRLVAFMVFIELFQGSILEVYPSTLDLQWAVQSGRLTLCAINYCRKEIPFLSLCPLYLPWVIPSSLD